MAGGDCVKIVAEEKAEVFSSRDGRLQEGRQKGWWQESALIGLVWCIVVGEVVDNNIWWTIEEVDD